MVYVIIENDEPLAVCQSLDLAKECVHMTWGNEYIKQTFDFKSFTRIEIRKYPKIGEQRGLLVTKVEIQAFDIVEEPTSL